MVGFVIGEVKLEQMQVLVDRVDQADALSQQMHGANAAAGNAMCFVGNFVLNVTGTEGWPESHGVFLLIEPARNSVLAFCEPTSENDLHLKSFRG